MRAVRPHTIKGLIICGIIYLLCLPLRLFKGNSWKKAREFEENPRTMNFYDLVYFAYKYYYKSPLLPSDDSVVKHFENAPAYKVEIDKVLATISLGGDLMPYSMIQNKFTSNLWDEIGSDFFGSDIVFANLETPLDKDKKSKLVPEVMLYDMHFNTDISTFDIFSAKPVYKDYDILSIANNHTMDQGIDGIDKTIGFLNSKGIKSVGAKLNESQKDYEIIEINGVKIAFLAFTYSLNQFEMERKFSWKVNVLPLNTEDCKLEKMIEISKKCREDGAEFIIASLHCGNAYQAYPSLQTVRLFERIFESCGIDIIAGTHPHNLQGWRNYEFKDPLSNEMKRGFAIYSIGDFIAYDIFTWGHLCAYLKIEIGKDRFGKIIFNPSVKPMIMLREKKQLKLKYAENVFSEKELSNELKDMKVLYDICTNQKIS